MPHEIQNPELPFQDQDPKNKIRQDAEQLILECEKAYGISLTIHDMDGHLCDQEGISLLESRHLHLNPYCWNGRVDHPEIAERCVQHCRDHSHALAPQHPEGWVQSCWKGVTEFVLPVLHNDQLALVMYAGAFLSETPSKVSPWSDPEFPLTKTLRPLSTLQQDPFRRLLFMLGRELLHHAQLIRGHSAVQTDPRISAVRKYLHQYAHHDIKLEHLAKELHLSPSRCSHFISEKLGQSFQQLLLIERIRRSQLMLKETTWAIEDIAFKNGFRSSQYFFKAFKKLNGLTPKRYRESQKSIKI